MTQYDTRHEQSVDAETSTSRFHQLLDILIRTANVLERIEADAVRIADHFDPPPPNKVGTPYVAERLGCTTVWVAEMIRSGQIPKACVVEGTGNGKLWKFHRKRIDLWIQSR